MSVSGALNKMGTSMKRYKGRSGLAVGSEGVGHQLDLARVQHVDVIGTGLV